VRLFVDRARLVRPSFSVNDQNASAVAEICHRLDGIPLAIELAAALVRGLTVEQILERLSDRFRLLTAGPRTALPKQQTLRAAIDWSYELLSRAERALFRRLSVFAGGWDLEGAEAVGAGKLPEGGEVRTEEVWELMMRLIDKSLVVVEGEMGRYQMLETLREYGQERLQEAGEAEETRKKHLEFFLGLAERAEGELQGTQQREWLERLEKEQDNFRAALSYGLEREPEKALKLAAALWRFWDIHSNFTEGRSWLERALEKGMSAPASVRAKALNRAGVMAWRQGDHSAAQALLEESLTLFRELGDQRGIANVLNYSGNIAWAQGDLERAKALHEESLAIRRALGDQGGIASSLGNLGNIAWAQGDYERAKVLYEECLALFRELGNQWGVANVLNNLGVVVRAQGDYGRARVLLEESLTLFRGLGSQWGIVNALEELAKLAGVKGQRERAARLLGAAEALREVIGAPMYIPERSDYEQIVTELRSALGDEAFAVAWEEGRTMTLEQAIAYALEHPDT
jgi:tetratricopeptide (TPR) repeat protein